MENRFGVKDLFMFGLLAVLLVMVGLSMVQFDRQYVVMQRMEASLNDIRGDRKSVV